MSDHKFDLGKFDNLRQLAVTQECRGYFSKRSRYDIGVRVNSADNHARLMLCNRARLSAADVMRSPLVNYE